MTMNNNNTYWMYLIDKINSEDNIDVLIPDILRDLCEFLHFGCGFVYKADHSGRFLLAYSHSAFYPSDLKDSLDLHRAFGNELMSELAHSRKISFRESSEKNALTLRLAKLFNVKSMNLVPIVNHQYEPIGFVGISDRRGTIRIENDNEAYIYSILSTLAVHVKLQIYQKKTEDTLQALMSTMDNMGVDIYVNDYHTHEVLYANKSMAIPYGGIENMIGKPCWQVLYEGKTGQCDFCPRPHLLDEQGNPAEIYSWDYEHRFDGSWFRVLSAAFRWVDGRMAHVVSSVDITENKKNEMIIRKMAEYDLLTGLPNRHRLNVDCEQIIENKKSSGYVLFFDLDGFKAVNDMHGHEVGDQLLKQIGAYLQSNPLTHNRCYRYGGDEFVIICSDEPGEIEAIIQLLQSRFSSSWQLEDGEAEAICNVSIGITRYPDDDKKSSELLRKADHAMYVSKRTAGKGLTHFYNQGKICTAEEYFAKRAE